MADGGTAARARRRNLLLCLLPWGYCIAATVRYGYDAPYWDQWWKVPIIGKAFEGTLAFSDLWTLINEHRVFFPNVISVPLARLTHWDIRVELGLTLLFATLTFGLIVLLFRRVGASLRAGGTLWPLPIAAVLIFSFSQRAVWMWSLHLMITMTTLCLVAIVLLLGNRRPTRAGFPLAIAAAVVGSYTFGAGVVAWPLGVVMLSLVPDMGKRRRSMLLAVWMSSAALTMLLYFVAYESTPANESAFVAMRRPLSFLVYVLAYMGSPLFSFSPNAAVLAGLAGLVMGGFLVFHLFRGDDDARESALPFVGLMFIGWAVAGLVGLKQVQEGIGQAVSSRYIPWPTLFWIGLLGLAYVRRLGAGDSLRKWELNAIRAASALVLLLALSSSGYGTYRADEQHDAFVLGRKALLEGRTDDDLLYLYPDVTVPSQMRETLVRYQLSIFRGP